MCLISTTLFFIIKHFKKMEFKFFRLVLLPPIKLIIFTISFIIILNFSIYQVNNIKYKFKMANQMVSMIKKIPKKYRTYTMNLCDKYKVPIYIVSRIINIESEWNPKAISKWNRNGTRDYGLGQLNSRYILSFIKWFYRGREKFNVFNWKHNLQVSIKFLASLGKMFYGNWRRAIYAYNAGPTAVKRNRIPLSTCVYANKILSPINI